MIRILHYIGSLNIGGSQAMLMGIYRNIDRDKIQFDFVVDKENELFFAKEIEKMGGKIYAVPQYKGYNHLLYIKAWNKIFSEHPEYRVIHSHVRSTASIVLKIAKKYNLITIAHSHSTSNGKGLKSVIKRIFQKSIPKYADYLFACSKESAIWLYGEKNAKSDRCIIINNAIDASKFIYDEKIREDKRKELGLENKIVIGQVGRLEYVKNHFFTLQVLKKCIEVNPNYVLLIVGDGSLKDKIIEEIEKMGLTNNVIILSNRSDVNELLQAIDLFIMPSIYEGLPLTLVEAQTASLPCVVSDTITDGFLISKLVYKLNLNDSEEVWVETINKNINTKRTNNFDEISKLGFDIKNNAKWIADFYLDVVEE